MESQFVRENIGQNHCCHISETKYFLSPLSPTSVFCLSIPYSSPHSVLLANSFAFYRSLSLLTCVYLGIASNPLSSGFLVPTALIFHVWLVGQIFPPSAALLLVRPIGHAHVCRTSIYCKQRSKVTCSLSPSNSVNHY